MSRILAVSDIHIHDYPNRNPDGQNNFRLYQGSRTVADNIIKQGKSYKCDYIVFAGDIIEKFLIRPYIQSEVKLFLDHIMSNFKGGWIIWGNHDIDNKSNDQTINDSCLGVMLPGNLKYAHRTIEHIDNTVIAFSNWQQDEIDLTWIPGKVDVLFTHARICYSSNVDFFESVKLDDSKFDVAICGDIHTPGQIGKYVSIGIPQKCKMTDSDYCSGVVYDCTNKSWTWIDLNPDDNLMKFAYTDSLEKEGWCADDHTYYVYKAANNATQDTGKKTVIAEWEKIETLINNTISSSGLTNIHTTVLQNISNVDSEEVDFDFTLIRFHCENWRSISEADINFQDGDKILIKGENGSGKTSLLSAIKYAFVDVGDTTGLSSLKPFIQFGEKECLTEVEFLYQGNKCRIMRGTKSYGLWLNDEQQKYSDKKTFEKDVRERFPFIAYIDAFFFDSDHHQFIGGMTPERKTDIISKFLKLNRLDTYNKVATGLLGQLKLESSGWEEKIRETQKLLSYIETKLNSYSTPSVDKNTLLLQKQEGLEIQRKYEEWNKFKTELTRLQVEKQNYLNKLGELDRESKSFRSVEEIDQELYQIEQERQQNQSKLVDLGNIRVNLQYKEQELKNLIDEGNNAYKEAKSIGLGKVCNSCGQVIKTTEAMELHKRELENKVEELRPRIEALKAEVQNLYSLRNNSEQEYININSNISNLNLRSSQLMSEKNTMSRIFSDIERYKTSLENTESELRQREASAVEEIELPANFMETMSNIQIAITTWEQIEENNRDKAQKELELAEYSNNLKVLIDNARSLEDYIKLTGPTGLIYEEIMNKLKTKFSDNLVEYKVVRKGKANREHLSLNPQYRNNGNLVDYDACSSGQKTILDIHFLQKIVTRLGLLIMDEFLKHLDPKNHDVCIDMINDMSIGCIMISSHMESIAQFNNKTCELSLSNNGETIIKLT